MSLIFPPHLPLMEKQGHMGRKCGGGHLNSGCLAAGALLGTQGPAESRKLFRIGEAPSVRGSMSCRLAASGKHLDVISRPRVGLQNPPRSLATAWHRWQAAELGAQLAVGFGPGVGARMLDLDTVPGGQASLYDVNFSPSGEWPWWPLPHPS